MATEIDHVVDYVDDVNAVWGNKLADGIAMRTPMPFRLTLESGVPVSVTDQTAKTVLRTAWTGLDGNRIHLLDGSTVKPYTIDTLPTASLTALAPSTIYDVFGYPLAGVPTLELVAWASTTARASALTDEQGYKVKSSDGKRYLGSILSDAAGGACTQTKYRNGIWNAYNQVWRPLYTYNSTASWTKATSTWEEWNAGTGQVRGEFVVGLPGYPLSEPMLGHYVSGTYGIDIALEFDSTNATNRLFAQRITSGNLGLLYHSTPTLTAIGYHFITQTASVSIGTATINGGTNWMGKVKILC